MTFSFVGLVKDSLLQWNTDDTVKEIHLMFWRAVLQCSASVFLPTWPIGVYMLALATLMDTGYQRHVSSTGIRQTYAN